MANSCVYTPSKGKEVYRKLTKDLGHKLGTELFLISINPSFKDKFKNTLSLTAEGIPTFDSIMSNPIVQTYIGESAMLSYISSELGELEFEHSVDGINEAFKKADNFNTESVFRNRYLILPRTEDNKVKLVIVRRSADTLNTFRKLKEGQYVLDKITSIANTLPVKQAIETSFREYYNGDNSDIQLFYYRIKALRDILDGGTDTLDYINAANIIVPLFGNNNFVERVRNYVLAIGAEEILDKHRGFHQDELTDNDINTATGLMILDAITTEGQPSIVYRALDHIREAIGEVNFEAIQTAFNEAQEQGESFISEEVAEVSSNTAEEFSSEQLSSIEDSLDELLSIIEQLKEGELKKLNLGLGDIKGLKSLDNKKSTILQNLHSYLENSLSEISNLFEKLDKLDDLPFNERCKVVKNALDYYNFMGTTLETISKALESNDILKEFSKSERDKITSVINSIQSINNNLNTRGSTLAQTYFTELIKPIVGDNVVITYGKNKGKQISVKDLIVKNDRDVSIISRLLDSAGNSTDVVLQAAHSVIKKEKDKVRLKTILATQEILSLGLKAEQAGVKDFTFMYEKDSYGNRTGFYITEYNIGNYEVEYRKFRESIKKEPEESRNKKLKEWHKENSVLTKDGYRPNSNYLSAEFKDLTPAQREFYQEFMRLKEQADSLLPDGEMGLNEAIKIRKDLWNRLKTSSSPRALWSNIQESVKDALMDRSDDTEFGITRLGKTDLKGTPVRTPPIYFTRTSEDENMNDLTDDLVGSLIAYTYMANNFNAMNSIADALELGRQVVKSTEYGDTRGESNVVERVVGLGIDKALKVPKTESEAAKLYEDMMDSQVYGIYLKDEGVFGETKLNKQKVTSAILRMGSSVQLGLNFLAGIANAANGLAMQNIEAAAGEFFSVKELAAADRYYMSNVASMVGEIGSRAKTNKLDLIFEYFNVKQDYDKEIGNKKFDRRNFITRTFGPSVLYLYQTLGDNFLYGRAALAMLSRYQIIDKNGNKKSLFDVLTPIPIDPNNPSLGSKIDITGLKKLDGSDFTENDVSIISRKIERVNQLCFGVYNKDDVNAARRTMLGKFLLQYRDWMRPAWNRRFQRTHYDVLLQQTREGYYQSGWRFTKQLYKDLRNGQLQIMKTFNSMTKEEQYNVKRCLFEVSQFTAVAVLYAILDGTLWKDRDKDDMNWAESMLKYTLRRQITELGSVIPGPTMVSEGFKILKSPMAAVNVMESSVDLLNLLYPPNYTDELESGRYKGHSTAYKTLFNSPIGLQSKNIYRMLNPEDAISYLEN